MEVLEQRRTKQGMCIAKGTGTVRIIRKGLWRRNDLSDAQKELIVYGSKDGRKKTLHTGRTPFIQSFI